MMASVGRKVVRSMEDVAKSTAGTKVVIAMLSLGLAGSVGAHFNRSQDDVREAKQKIEAHAAQDGHPGMLERLNSLERSMMRLEQSNAALAKTNQALIQAILHAYPPPVDRRE